jgi:aryl-alcohol dehydrogenase-like predicted oxidoreductase
MIGFGCYRITDVNPTHAEAVERARELGVTLFDTSSNYGDGASERLVGKAAGAVFVTKYGYIQGSMLEQIKAQESMGQTIPELVKLSDSLWHCIHPEFLEQAFQISCERMNRTSLDVVLLHNPEYYLQHAHQAGIAIGDARDELYRRFTDAFRWFEQTIAGGRLRSYGVSSNTFAYPVDATDAVCLARTLQAAEEAGGKGHHFTHAQMPMNLLEHFAATSANTPSRSDGAMQTPLEFARENNIHILVNRPLNAIVDNDLIRLVSHTMPEKIIHPQDIEQRIHDMETREHDLANKLQAEGNLNERDVQVLHEAFRVAGALCQSWSKFEGLIHWRDVERSYLAPRINAAAVLGARSIHTTEVDEYIHDLTTLLSDLDTMYAQDENASLEELRQSLANVFQMDPESPLQHIAIHALNCTQGIGTVLVGMRTPAYVDDVMSVIDLPQQQFTRSTWEEVVKVLRELSD